MSMSEHKNPSIACTITNCANHCPSENYCSLNKILIGSHEANPTADECTDCKSFSLKAY